MLKVINIYLLTQFTSQKAFIATRKAVLMVATADESLTALPKMKAKFPVL